MGKHYVDRYYLRGFSTRDSPDKIWQYDRISGDAKELPIAAVAQARDFYPDEVESYLHEQVEQPAHEALDKLRKGEELDPAERRVAALYLCTATRRVPKYRRFLEERVIPEALADVFARWENAFRHEAVASPDRVGVLENRLNELRRMREEWTGQLPPELSPGAMRPNLSESVVSLLCSMTWRLLVAPGPSGLLTSDNPVFYDVGLGMLKPNSELTFPICSRIVLWLSWRPDLEEGFFPTTEQAIKEVNRRTVSNASRLVFYHERAPWVLQLVAQRNHRLTRLV